MTDAIIFFQAIFTFKNFSVPTANKHEVKLAVALKMEAERLAAAAGKEMKNGYAAGELALKAADQNKIRSFTEIALWHYGHAAEYYEKSARRYEEAGKINTGKSRIFNAKAKEMMRRTAQSAAALDLLKSF